MPDPVLRRPKRSPCDDFWHTIRVGIPIFVVLLVALPVMFKMFG